ncbi:stress up-regulated Nod 19 protein [Trifolium repens]|nr:stress up-regulated Nod 19 protein [Trifolium repens]
MCSMSGNFVFSLAILLLLSTSCSGSILKTEDKVKSAFFLSPKFELGPGSVVNGFYYDIDFPRGHIAIKSFDAEVVDEAGNPVPLHETYLHHWLVVRYHQSKANLPSDIVFIRNSGICQETVLPQYFGLGSETRGTATDIPDPFGIEIGNPAEIPEGFEEKWMVNVHAIDTRGAEDKSGCTECKCDLYNVTVDAHGRSIRPDYKGGLLCCYDDTQCKLKEGFEGPKRSLYLKYTIKWVDWDDFIVPVKIYIFDVSDTLKLSDDSKGTNSNHNCKNEYQVESCSTGKKEENGCVHVKRTNLPLQTGGYVIYAVAHQHSGGIGATLYGQDGRVICSSKPTYGNGNEVGNEAGYIVGMSTCYPQPGSINIIDGETLTLESIYNNTKEHAGVMGLFYLLVAEQLPYQQFRHSTRSSFFMDVNKCSIVAAPSVCNFASTPATVTSSVVTVAFQLG